MSIENAFYDPKNRHFSIKKQSLIFVQIAHDIDCKKLEIGLFHIWLWKFLWKTSVRVAFSELVAIVLEEGEGERDLQREREREKKKKKKKKKIIRSVFHSAKNAIFRVLENVCGRFHILSCVFIFPFLKSRAIMGSKQDHGGQKGNLCREVSSQSDRGRFRWCEKRSR